MRESFLAPVLDLYRACEKGFSHEFGKGFSHEFGKGFSHEVDIREDRSIAGRYTVGTGMSARVEARGSGHQLLDTLEFGVSETSENGNDRLTEVGMTSWGGVDALARREVKRFFRQRSRVTGALLTPIMFWVVLGSGLRRSFMIGGGSAPSAGIEGPDYLEYFFPGTLALVVLFTAIFSTISIIEDRKEGFLQGVLAAPVGRSAIVVGKIAGCTTLTMAQGLLFLLLAPLSGAPLTITSALCTLGVILMLSTGMAAMGFLIAWSMDSTQGFHAIMNLFLMPMWLLSGAVFPAGGASGWIAWVMAINPMTYGVAAIRRALYWNGHASVTDLPSMGVCLGVLATFGAVMLVWCGRIVRRSG